MIGDFEAMLGGIFAGLSVFVMKTVLSDFSINLSSVFILTANPVTWVGLVLGGIGFFLFQKSLHSGDVSIVAPVMTGFGIITPVIMAVTIIGEAITSLKSAGLFLVIVGVFLMAKK